MVKFGGNWTAQRLGVLGALVLTLLLGASAATAYRRFDAGIRQTTIRHLGGVVRATQSSLEYWFQIQVHEARLLADDSLVKKATQELVGAPGEMLSSGVHPAQCAFRQYLRPILDRRGELDGLIVDEEGRILAAVREGGASTGVFGSDEHRKRIVRVFAGHPQFAPPLASNQTSQRAIGIMVPIRPDDERIVAVLVLQADVRGKFSSLTHSGRFGNTVEIYAFDEQGRALTDDRFGGLDIQPQNGSAATPTSTRQLTQLTQAISHKRSGDNASGYVSTLGQRVLGSWAYSHELGIGVGVEIAEDEALSANRAMRYLLFGGLAGVVGLLAALTMVAVRHRVRIQQLINESNAKLEERVAERTRELSSANGRLALEVNERRTSESRLRAVQAMLEETTEKYARLSQIDPLTELANRRRFDEFLEREWRRCIRNRSEMSLLLLDFDYFKLFNDTYGHSAGDECLRAVAEVLSAAARRPGDLAARIGGEEFAVVLCDTGCEGAMRVARQIHAWIEDLAIEHDTTQVMGVDNVTVSIGIANMQPELTSTPSVLVYHADEALYAAKQDGRNCVRIYEVGTNHGPEDDETFTRTKGLKAHELVRRNHR